MRIICKQKDYYDYQAEMYGVDGLHVWERKLAPNDYYVNSLGAILEYIYSDKILFNDTQKYRYLSDVCVGGKYRCLHGRYYEIAVHIGFHTVYIGAERYLKKDKLVRNLFVSVDDNIDNKKERLQVSKEPIYVTMKTTNTRLHDNDIIDDVLLSYLGVQKFVDAQTAYLWVDEFVSYVNSHVDMVEISNKDKIIQHGFDIVSSFRNVK